MESEIEGLIDEGWKPRIKTRKNRKYITLRKGNKEKSLGPFTEKLWDEIKPVEPWATPAQITELEKRISELEESQRGSNPSLLEKRISKLEESQRGSKPYLLKRRISKLEENHRVDMRIINSSITDFRKLREELIESAKRRHLGHYECKKINSKGYCSEWWYGEGDKPEYIRPIAWREKEGKKVWYINVRENPIVCSACPDYEPKS